jgi:hypothetical protein
MRKGWSSEKKPAAAATFVAAPYLKNGRAITSLHTPMAELMARTISCPHMSLFTPSTFHKSIARKEV